VKLVLLGTGGYYTNDRRHTACLMLPEAGVVLDAGTGIFRLRDYLATDRLDIFLTHAHLDHVIGLTYLMDLLPPDVLARTTVHAEPAKIAAVREHLFAEPVFPVAPPFALQPLAREVALADGGTLRYFRLAHPGGSVGFRLDWPSGSMAYVTDTTAGASAPYLDDIRGVDVLVHEAYFGDEDPHLAEITGHSRLPDVARLAAAADVGVLIMVHVNPQLADDNDFDCDAARKMFANTHLGSDQMELEF